jgi:mannose-6-phosphate isomerase-like protein (cupin superfamily)
MQSLSDGTHLYDVEHRAYHQQRPGFRIAELHISPEQSVPWHFHNFIKDTFYVLEGELLIHLKAPEAEIHLEAGESYPVAPGRPHLVTNCGTGTAKFMIMQGMGQYDYVPLEA